MKKSCWLFSPLVDYDSFIPLVVQAALPRSPSTLEAPI
jgi:hypothetical protein